MAFELMAKDIERDETMRRGKLLEQMVPGFLLVFAVLLLYAGSFEHAFVFDDLVLIRGNKALASWHSGLSFFSPFTSPDGALSPFYRPLQMLLYLCIYQAVGASVVAFHGLNICLHALDACLIYWLGQRLRFRRMPCFLASLLWAVHPVQTEVISYASGTADPLVGAFLLSATLVLAGGFGWRQRLLASVFFVAALLSKETAIVFPGLAMGLIFYRSNARWRLQNYFVTWIFWAIAGLYLFLRSAAASGGIWQHYATTHVGAAGLAARFATFLATLPSYVGFLLWPHDLHFIQNFPVYRSVWGLWPLAGLSAFLAACLAVLGIGGKKTAPLAWGVVWAACLHFPQSGIAVPMEATLLEHWLYLPSMGLFLGFAETLDRCACRRGLRVGLAAIALGLAGVLATLTTVQEDVWQDAFSFYGRILAAGDASGKAYEGLGLAYAEKGKFADAAEAFRIALDYPAPPDQALRAALHYNLGTALVNQAQLAASSGGGAVARVDRRSPLLSEGIKELTEAGEAGDAEAWEALVYIASFHLGDPALARTYRDRAAALKAAGLSGP